MFHMNFSTNPHIDSDIEFPQRIRNIAQALSYDQDVSQYNPNEVAAAKLWLVYQERGVSK